MRVIIIQQLGQSKIRYIRLQSSIQKNIAGFDVPVNDAGAAVMVQIRQSTSSTSGYFHAISPAQQLLM